MRRHYITEGSYTTAGGVVVSATSRKTIDGVRAAVENDKIACPSCKSTGHIVCTGPRIPDFCDGKAMALENDFCVCGCVPPPRLIPTQGRWFQTIEDGSYKSVPVQPKPKNNEELETSEDGYDQFFHLSDEVSGKPLANRYYRMIFKDKVIEGKTDEQGRTQKVEAEHAAEVQIEIFPEGYEGSRA